MSEQPEGGRDDRATDVVSAMDALGEKLGRGAASLRRYLTEHTPHAPGEGSRMEQAEHLVRGVEERAAGYLSTAGHGVRRVFARAREEAEDIVAEARARTEQKGGKRS